MNHFELFNLPISFQIDEAKLKKSFLLQSKQLHPDFHSNDTTSDQLAALEQSSQLNKAYTTLRNPDSRMAYILEWQGKLGAGIQPEPMPPAFLMEMMEINEAIMELEFNFDQNRWQKTKQLVESVEKELQDQIEPILQQWSPEHPENEKFLAQVLEFYFKRKYLLRVSEKLYTFAPS